MPEIKYQIHQMAELFPLPSPEEYASIKEHVQQQGFIFPIVFWKDANGAMWLIDGRTRDRIATELHKAGIDKAANGADIKLTSIEFGGTEAEAVRYVRGLNLSRRALDSGQKAAAAVLSGKMYRRFKAKEDGVDLTELEADEDEGDFATRIAKDAGTNRQYVYDCMRLDRTCHDILLLVLKGDIKIQEAKRRADRRSKGLPDVPDDATPEPVEVKPEPSPDTIFDGLGNEVADDLKSVFKFRLAATAAKKAFNKTLEDLQAACEEAGGRNASYQTLRSDVQNAVRHLDNHQPHAACPYCAGTGRAGDPEFPDKRCGECKGRKFLDALQWKQVPKELREMFEKPAPDAGEKGGYGL